MPPRKCVNCRYFRDAAVPASGWCVHPEREPLRDLVLVRQFELACRTMTDEDLWEAGAAYLAARHVHEYIAGVH